MTPAAPSKLSRTVLAGGQMINGESHPAWITIGT